MANKTYVAFVDKQGGTTATSYIGNEGELFYDPTTTTLRVSDGSTPGGTVVSAGGATTTNTLTSSSETLVLGPLGQLTNDVETITISPTSREGASDYLQISTLFGTTLATSGDLILGANTGNVDYKTWNFAANGSIFFPNSTRLDTQTSDGTIQLYSDTDSTGFAQLNYADQSFVWVDPIGTHLLATGNRIVEIEINNDGASNTWSFQDGGRMVFPDDSVQTGASISIADLKTLVAASTDFDNFKTRIAAL